MKKISICITLLILTTLISLGAQKSATGDARYWPQWRGPFHNGMAASDAPLRWSNTENIRWKTAIPGRGFSTPIIWGERIFLTTAIPTKAAAQTDRPAPRHPNGGAGAMQEHQFVVICLDRKSGAVVWQKTAKTAVPHEGYHRFYGSFASNSPVTDGRYVYAFFGSRGIYCYDLNGKLIWERDHGVQMRMRNEFGEGAAPALDDNLLILKYDQETDSFIVALDKNTGKEMWRKKRDEVSAWTTPLVIEHAGRKQVVVSATNRVRGYDFKHGNVIWECGGLGLNAIPAPVYQDGVVYAMTGFQNPRLMAIRLGKEGDLTGTEAVMWNETRGTSYTASPVLHDNKLYVLTDNGMVSCFNARTGEPFYHRQRLPKSYNFKASPVGANGKLYLASEDNDVIVLKMGEKYEVLATNTLDDQTFIASPIIVDNEIYLRSEQYLFCVSETGAKDKP